MPVNNTNICLMTYHSTFDITSLVFHIWRRVQTSDIATFFTGRQIDLLSWNIGNKMLNNGAFIHLRAFKEFETLEAYRIAENMVIQLFNWQLNIKTRHTLIMDMVHGLSDKTIHKVQLFVKNTECVYFDDFEAIEMTAKKFGIDCCNVDGLTNEKEMRTTKDMKTPIVLKRALFETPPHTKRVKTGIH